LLSFAGIRGYFDAIELPKVLSIEKQMLDYIFATTAFVPFVELLKEEFDDSIFDVVIENFLRSI
jgi:hypothetical protein